MTSAHTIYLDTEFNSFGGELISLGMCSTDGLAHCYIERAVNIIPMDTNGFRPRAQMATSGKLVHPWVDEHVIPHLSQFVGGRAYSREQGDHLIWKWLSTRQDQTIVADWPADFEHLMSCIYEDNGMRPQLELKMHLLPAGLGLSDGSTIPHNALEDARALMEAHQKWISDNHTNQAPQT